MKRARSASLRVIFIFSILFVSLSFLWASPAPSTSQFNSKTSKERSLPKFEEIEKAVFDGVNHYRKSQGLLECELDKDLSEICRFHSEEMARGSRSFGHDRFNDRVKAITFSYEEVAENVASNRGHSDPVEAAVAGWIKSNGHRENMKGKYNVTGVGVAQNARGQYYFTQIFVRRSKA
jgi:uncharacterized protein YkwD